MPPQRVRSLALRPGAIPLASSLCDLAPILLLAAVPTASLAAPMPDPSRPAPGGQLARLVGQAPKSASGGPSTPVSPSPNTSSPDLGDLDPTSLERSRATSGVGAADGSVLVVAGAGFAGWHSLNDTIMGGRSQGQCQAGSSGLVMTAEVVAEGGGFVSCRSPLFSPPLDLSAQASLNLELEGDGRRYKLAIACSDGLAGLTELIPGGLRWVAEFGTETQGITQVSIPFSQLRASVRAKPVGLPLRFDPARITRLQLLHSRFGDDGGVNSGFRAGPLRLTIHAIRALP